MNADQNPSAPKTNYRKVTRISIRRGRAHCPGFFDNDIARDRPPEWFTYVWRTIKAGGEISLPFGLCPAPRTRSKIAIAYMPSPFTVWRMVLNNSGSAIGFGKTASIPFSGLGSKREAPCSPANRIRGGFCNPDLRQ